MASTNAFLTMYNTAQANSVGSTISTGFIPYISTGGKQVYTSTLTTLTFSTVNCSSITATSGLNLSVPTGQGITFQVGGSTIGTVTSSGFPGGGMTGAATVLFSQGTSGTFSGTGYKTLWIRLVGGGGSGAGGGAGLNPGNTGNPSSVTGSGLTTMNAGGGGGGAGPGTSTYAAGGSASGGNVINIIGGAGQSGNYSTGNYLVGGTGGSSPLGASGSCMIISASSASINGAGGCGSAVYSNASGGGGGGGGYCESIIANPTGTYTVTIGASVAGVAGVSVTSGAGGAGYCIAIGYY